MAQIETWFVSQFEADALKCPYAGKPTCNGRHEVQAQCHPASPLIITYEQGSGLLAIECASCGSLVLFVAVASQQN